MKDKPKVPEYYFDIRVRDARGTLRHIDPEPYVLGWTLAQADG